MASTYVERMHGLQIKQLTGNIIILGKRLKVLEEEMLKLTGKKIQNPTDSDDENVNNSEVTNTTENVSMGEVNDTGNISIDISQ